MHVVEGWEIDTLIGLYGKELRKIKEDTTLTDEERKLQRGIVLEQVKSLRQIYETKTKARGHKLKDFDRILGD